MSNMKFNRIRAICSVVLCISTLAHASGWMPPVTTEKTFESHQACLAVLEAAYARDKSQVIPRTVAADDKTQEVNLITNGIKRIDADTARYEAKFWYHHGVLRPDVQKIETSHSWEGYIYECNGKTLKTTRDYGYTLSTFDPVDRSVAPVSSKATN